MSEITFTRTLSDDKTLTSRVHVVQFSSLVDGTRFWSNDEMGPYYKTSHEEATRYDAGGVYMFRMTFDPDRLVRVVTKELSKSC